MNSKIVIIHAEGTYQIAQKIKGKLEEQKLFVILKDEGLFKDVNYYTNPNDYVILLVPKLEERDCQYKDNFLNIISEFNYRDINFITVNLEKKPDSSLKSFINFNLFENENKSINMLVRYLTNIKFLSFDIITPSVFEELIVDLLKKMNFKVEGTNIRNNRYEIDILATSKNSNQLVGTFKNKWIIECKLYKHSRIDIDAIRQLASLISGDFSDCRGILITNGIITSAAQEALEILKVKESVNIHLVDGSRLKKLILKYPDLIVKYFQVDSEV